ncbi:MerC family mercury resistance protein [Hymenobacter antarcticus]|uniref:MerC family mercury resistance protein n=1 Tax=Hymenobacter antarcticus TaxID=486270 RepID=UPI0031E73B7D
MQIPFFRQAADYGGALNAALCAAHCAAGPLLFAWWGARAPAAAAEQWEPLFLVLSGVLVALATWRRSSARLRLALWALFGVFAASALLAEQWPALEYAQYAASAGLLLTHLLNQRHCRRCQGGSCAT